MPRKTRTVYRTYTDGALKYTGPDLEEAIRTWDREAPAGTAGGVAVAVYEVEGSDESLPYDSGLLQLRDGWILHVLEDGTVYLHPRLSEQMPLKATT